MQYPRVLRQSVGVVAQASITQRDVEKPVRPKQDVAAPVIRQRLGNFQQHALSFRQRVRCGILGAGGAHFADHRAARVVLRVAQVKKTVLGKTRVKGDPVYPFFKKHDPLHLIPKVQKRPPLPAAIQSHRAKFPPLHRDHLLPARIRHTGQRHRRVKFSVKRQLPQHDARQRFLRDLRRRDFRLRDHGQGGGDFLNGRINRLLGQHRRQRQHWQSEKCGEGSFHGGNGASCMEHAIPAARSPALFVTDSLVD